MSFFLKNSFLIFQLTKREFEKKYRGSLLGFIWTFANPLILLFTYTFVFTVAVKSSWGSFDKENNVAIIIYSGLILQLFFSECLNSSSSLIYGNVNYVKKVVFPLEILILPHILTGIFNYIINIIFIVLVLILLNNNFHKEIILIPILIIPLICLIAGIMLIFSALGVFIRDIGQLSGIISTVMLFVSGVFFPIKELPEIFQKILYFNPLAQSINSTRDVIFLGTIPDFNYYISNLISGLLVFLLGVYVFKRLRKSFADAM